VDASGIVGRDRELAVLASFVEDPRDCLVLEGEAGVGKTTLWRTAADAARERGVRVLEARPVEAEATLAFAAVGDLLRPVLEHVLGELPGPQADVLSVALLLAPSRDAVPDDRSIAVSVLGALRAVAAGGPVLMAVDDIQWLDRASAAALAFAWRRLADERVGLVAGRRIGGPAPDLIGQEERTTRLIVEPLSMLAVERMLQAHLDLVLPRPVLVRLYEVAAGNAFYAMELGRAMRSRGVVPAPGEPLPVPERLRDLMRERLSALPESSREALAATAALAQPTLSLVAREFGGEDALVPALRTSVLEVDGERLRFTHPLLAKAAYEEIDVIARRSLHRRLAALVADEEEAARHLALGATGPGIEVSAVLERAAEHARSRGATLAAAELCELARQRTPAGQSDDRDRRAIAAARYRWLSGDTRGAAALLEEVTATAPAGARRAEAMVALARMLQMDGAQPRALELARGALHEPGIDDALRVDAGRRVAMALMYMREELGAALGYARQAAAIAEPLGDATRAIAVSDVALLEALTGSPAAAATERAAIALGDGDWRGEGVLGQLAYNRLTQAMWTDRHEEAAEILEGLQHEVLRRGDEGTLPHLLAQRALADYLAGRWPDAVRRADAGYDAALHTGQRLSLAWTRSTRALVRASLGLEGARSDAHEALALAGERAMGVARIQSGWALGVLELSLERPADAVRVLSPLRERVLSAGVGEPASVRFVADEIEALITLDRDDEAVAVLGWLEERGRALDRASALAAAGRCRGLLAARRGDHVRAIAEFMDALREHERVPMPFERARTLLALGATQRRAKHRAAARASLAQALDVFERLGAALWAERTRGDIARIGGRAPGGDELTVTERRTAELVAQGLSNKEVAAALFVTPKTVETQLTRIYAKVGIHSRTELAVRLRDGNL
jgi:DNA-binding CsgD family transcriptional regulator